jgi:hypothetical protein
MIALIVFTSFVIIGLVALIHAVVHAPLIEEKGDMNGQLMTKP